MHGMSLLALSFIAIGDLLTWTTWKSVPPGLHTKALPLY